MSAANPNPVSSLSVVVPVYNSEPTLPMLVEALEPVLRALTPQFELVLVNDGSRDGSWRALQKLSAAHGWVRGINLMRNYGQHNALLCGIRAARFDVIVTLDDDLQHPPSEIPKLLARLEDNIDVVYGTPEKEVHGIARDLASLVTKLLLQNAMGAETARSVGAFRVFRTQVREAFAGYQGSFVSVDVLLTWGTTRFASVRVKHMPRAVGQSQYTFGKLVRHAMNMMTGFSTLPLQFASLTGFTFTLFGIALLIYVVARYLIQGVALPGFAFLASTISIFSGAQLFALGIIGEYLARMHFRMMDRPQYTVRSNSTAQPPTGETP